MMFKFTPRLFDIISEMIRGTHDQIRGAEREVMRYAVRRGRMDRTQFRTTFPGQESNPAWLDEQIAKAPADQKAYLEKYVLTYWPSSKIADIEKILILKFVTSKTLPNVWQSVKRKRVVPRKRWLKQTYVW